MTDIVDKSFERPRLGSVRVVLGGLVFSALVVTCESAVIIAASIATGTAYHLWAYGTSGQLSHYLSVGCITALLYTLPFLMRDDYRVHKLLEEPRSVGRVYLVWNYVFFCLALIGFVTKTTEAFSRGSLLLFYVCGLASGDRWSSRYNVKTSGRTTSSPFLSREWRNWHTRQI